MFYNEGNILPKDGEAIYFKNFFSEKESDLLFESLLNKINWQQQQIKMFGKLLNMPRLTAWYGDDGSNYKYSNLENKPLPWTEELLLIKAKIESISKANFNSVLLNLYRNGNDSMGWHRDDEKELGINPVIVSVSFGATRKFRFRHDKIKDLKCEIEVENGSLLLMKEETQHHWYHSLSKSNQVVSPRINLTFREIKQQR